MQRIRFRAYIFFFLLILGAPVQIILLCKFELALVNKFSENGGCEEQMYKYDDDIGGHHAPVIDVVVTEKGLNGAQTVDNGI